MGPGLSLLAYLAFMKVAAQVTDNIGICSPRSTLTTTSWTTVYEYRIQPFDASWTTTYVHENPDLPRSQVAAVSPFGEQTAEIGWSEKTRQLMKTSPESGEIAFPIITSQSTTENSPKVANFVASENRTTSALLDYIVAFGSTISQRFSDAYDKVSLGSTMSTASSIDILAHMPTVFSYQSTVRNEMPPATSVKQSADDMKSATSAYLQGVVAFVGPTDTAMNIDSTRSNYPRDSASSQTSRIPNYHSTSFLTTPTPKTSSSQSTEVRTEPVAHTATIDSMSTVVIPAQSFLAEETPPSKSSQWLVDELSETIEPPLDPLGLAAQHSDTHGTSTSALQPSFVEEMAQFDSTPGALSLAPFFSPSKPMTSPAVASTKLAFSPPKVESSTPKTTSLRISSAYQLSQPVSAASVPLISTSNPRIILSQELIQLATSTVLSYSSSPTQWLVSTEGQNAGNFQHSSAAMDSSQWLCPAEDGMMVVAENASFVVECYIDRIGSHIGTVPASSLSDCVTFCASMPNCVFAAYTPGSPNICDPRDSDYGEVIYNEIWGISRIAYTGASTLAPSRRIGTLIRASSQTQTVSTQSGQNSLLSTNIPISRCPGSSGANYTVDDDTYQINCYIERSGTVLANISSDFGCEISKCMDNCSATSECTSVSYWERPSYSTNRRLSSLFRRFRDPLVRVFSPDKQPVALVLREMVTLCNCVLKNNPTPSLKQRFRRDLRLLRRAPPTTITVNPTRTDAYLVKTGSRARSTNSLKSQSNKIYISTAVSQIAQGMPLEAAQDDPSSPTMAITLENTQNSASVASQSSFSSNYVPSLSVGSKEVQETAAEMTAEPTEQATILHSEDPATSAADSTLVLSISTNRDVSASSPAMLLASVSRVEVLSLTTSFTGIVRSFLSQRTDMKAASRSLAANMIIQIVTSESSAVQDLNSAELDNDLSSIPIGSVSVSTARQSTAFPSSVLEPYSITTMSGIISSMDALGSSASLRSLSSGLDLGNPAEASASSVLQQEFSLPNVATSIAGSQLDQSSEVFFTTKVSDAAASEQLIIESSATALLGLETDVPSEVPSALGVQAQTLSDVLISSNIPEVTNFVGSTLNLESLEFTHASGFSSRGDTPEIESGFDVLSTGSMTTLPLEFSLSATALWLSEISLGSDLSHSTSMSLPLTQNLADMRTSPGSDLPSNIVSLRPDLSSWPESLNGTENNSTMPSTGLLEASSALDVTSKLATDFLISSRESVLSTIRSMSTIGIFSTEISGPEVSILTTDLASVLPRTSIPVSNVSISSDEPTLFELEPVYTTTLQQISTFESSISTEDLTSSESLTASSQEIQLATTTENLSAISAGLSDLWSISPEWDTSSIELSNPSSIGRAELSSATSRQTWELSTDESSMDGNAELSPNGLLPTPAPITSMASISGFQDDPTLSASEFSDETTISTLLLGDSDPDISANTVTTLSPSVGISHLTSKESSMLLTESQGLNSSSLELESSLATTIVSPTYMTASLSTEPFTPIGQDMQTSPISEASLETSVSVSLPLTIGSSVSSLLLLSSNMAVMSSSILFWLVSEFSGPIPPSPEPDVSSRISSTPASRNVSVAEKTSGISLLTFSTNTSTPTPGGSAMISLVTSTSFSLPTHSSEISTMQIRASETTNSSAWLGSPTQATLNSLGIEISSVLTEYSSKSSATASSARETSPPGTTLGSSLETSRSTSDSGSSSTSNSSNTSGSSNLPIETPSILMGADLSISSTFASSTVETSSFSTPLGDSLETLSNTHDSGSSSAFNSSITLGSSNLAIEIPSASIGPDLSASATSASSAVETTSFHKAVGDSLEISNNTESPNLSSTSSSTTSQSSSSLIIESQSASSEWTFSESSTSPSITVETILSTTTSESAWGTSNSAYGSSSSYYSSLSVILTLSSLSIESSNVLTVPVFSTSSTPAITTLETSSSRTAPQSTSTNSNSGSSTSLSSNASTEPASSSGSIYSSNAIGTSLSTTSQGNASGAPSSASSISSPFSSSSSSAAVESLISQPSSTSAFTTSSVLPSSMSGTSTSAQASYSSTIILSTTSGFSTTSSSLSSPACPTINSLYYTNMAGIWQYGCYSDLATAFAAYSTTVANINSCINLCGAFSVYGTTIVSGSTRTTATTPCAGAVFVSPASSCYFRGPTLTYTTAATVSQYTNARLVTSYLTTTNSGITGTSTKVAVTGSTTTNCVFTLNLGMWLKSCETVSYYY